MIRLAVCEDDGIQLKILRTFIEEFLSDKNKSAEVICFSKGEDLLKSALETGFDIYFLDLLMPGLNGMEVAKKLRASGDKGKIVFQTSSLEYAAESYDVEAFYYLLKPVDKNKLYSVLERACLSINENKENILIKTKTGNVLTDISGIMFIDIENRVPVYHLEGGQKLFGNALRTSFKDLLGELIEREDFCLCNVSTLVNLACVSSACSERIVLKDGSEIYPSRNFWSAFNKTWKEYL